MLAAPMNDYLGPEARSYNLARNLFSATVAVVSEMSWFGTERLQMVLDYWGVVPKPMTSNVAARGQFEIADFAYNSDTDINVCPAGEKLTYRFTGQQDGKALRSYWSRLNTINGIRGLYCDHRSERSHDKSSAYPSLLQCPNPATNTKRFAAIY